MSIILESLSVQHDFGGGPHWYHESPFLPFEDSERKNLGASSLKDMATRRLFKDQSAVKPELFENVPWHIARGLWTFLGHKGKQTLLMWRIFHMRYPDQFLQVSPSYRLRTMPPKVPLKGYIDNIRSDACHWRAILSLSNAYAHLSDLVDIGTLRNLVALEIHTRRHKPSPAASIEPGDSIELEDGVMRSWVESAQSTGSLQHLQVLRIYRQKSLTHHVLSMLEKLPRLKIVVIYDCVRVTQGLGHHKSRSQYGLSVAGWSVQRWDWISSTQKTPGLEVLGPLSQLYENGVDSKNRDQTLDSSLPLLEFGLPGLDCDSPSIVTAKAQYAANSIFICTRATERKDRKRAPQETLQSQNIGKRKMRERGGKDMADVLGDFLGM